MSAVTIRTYSGPEDLDIQYRLWLRASEGLPYAWRSNPRNVRTLSAHVPSHRGSRLFAEREGNVIGYIGTHAPFLWEGLGTAVPFGFPWTWPVDEAVEAQLHEQMMKLTPSEYPESRIDLYIQRFRASWRRHLAFVLERGWREAWRDPILARPISKSTPVANLQPLLETDLEAVAALAAQDPCIAAPPAAAALARGFASGWQEWERSWLDPDAGAFSLEERGRWAEVKLFYAALQRLDEVLAAMDHQASRLGAQELYFTLRKGQTGRRASLLERGFRHVDDDVFVRYDLR